MLTGITGFIVLGYLIGLIAAALTIADMAASPRSAWRNTGRRRRNAYVTVIVSWFILGWGAVLSGLVWFAGNARTQVRISYFDHIDSKERDAAIAVEEIDEETINSDPPRRVDFAQTPGESSALSSRDATLKEGNLVDPPSVAKAEIDISIDISEVQAARKQG